MSFANLLASPVALSTGVTGAYIASNVAVVTFTPIYPTNGYTGTNGLIALDITWNLNSDFLIGAATDLILTVSVPAFARPQHIKQMVVPVFIAHPFGGGDAYNALLLRVNNDTITINGNSGGNFVIGDGVLIFNMSGIYSLS